MLEIFLPLPLDAPRPVKRRKKAQHKSVRLDINYNGKFVSVKDYEYIRVAKMVGETQVGINLFYLVDSSVILGYRNTVGYYLRSGANARPKQKVVQKKPPKVAQIGKGSSMYQ